MSIQRFKTNPCCVYSCGRPHNNCWANGSLIFCSVIAIYFKAMRKVAPCATKSHLTDCSFTAVLLTDLQQTPLPLSPPPPVPSPACCRPPSCQVVTSTRLCCCRQRRAAPCTAWGWRLEAGGWSLEAEYVYMNMYASMYACVCKYMYVCTYVVCMCVCV